MMRQLRIGVWLAVMIMTSACAPEPPAATATATATTTATTTTTPTATLTPMPTASPTVTPIPYPMRIEQVGQIGGAATVLALDGNIVYLQSGPRLVSVDVSNPRKPTFIGRSEILPGSVMAIAALDGHALVGDGEGKLWVFDVPESGDPRPISSIEPGGVVSDILVSGQYAYLAAGEAGLQIVDFSDPSHPVIVGGLAVEGSAVRITRAGNLVILGSRFQGPDPQRCDDLCDLSMICIIDVSNPARPDLLSATVESGRVSFVAVAGQTLYFESIGTKGFDISDPTNPTGLEETALPGFYSDIVTAAGSYLIEYELDWEDWPSLQPLTVLDVSDPHNRAEVITPLRLLPEDEIAASRRIVVRGYLVYVAIGEGLEIYDLSVYPVRSVIDPYVGMYKTIWQVIGELRTDVGTIGSGCCLGFYMPIICVIGDYLHTASGVWSLERPDDPVLVANPGPHPHCNGFPVKDGMILSSWIYEGAYTFLDMRDPDHYIEHKIPIDLPNGEIVAASENRLYVAVRSRSDSGDPSYTLHILDITDPYYPHLASSHTAIQHSHHNRYMVIGDYLYIEVNEGLNPENMVLDISDPYNPKEVNAPNLLFFDAEVLVHDNMVYVARADQIMIYALDNLLTPLAVLDMLGASDMWYSDGRLFVRSYSDEPEQRIAIVTVVDVQKPAQPKLLAILQQSPYTLTTYGDYLYLHLYNYGVGIFKLVPAHPTP